MLAILSYAPTQLLRALIAVGRWSRRHPRWASFLSIATVLYVTGFCVGSAAYADPLGGAHPDIPGDNLVDPNGVRASHYANLFISYGSLLDPATMWTAQTLNMWWGLVYNNIVNAIGLFQWVAGFTWITLIATPAEGIAVIVSKFLTQFQLGAFAFFLCGVVAGLYVMRNKWPAALVEVGMTIALSILAAGLFANPVQWITAPNGPLETAQQFGGQVSAAVSGNGYLQGEASKTNVIDDTISAPLVQVFVSDANQVISFGHILTGKCETTFHNAVATMTPNSAGRTAVHDAVAACDKGAGEYANSPTWTQLPEVFSVGAGTLGLFSGGLIFAVLAVGCALVLFWEGLRLMVATITGMFPFSDRSKFWRALFGVFACLIGVVFLTAALVLYLSFLSNVLTAVLSAGMGLIEIMNVVTIIIIVLFLLLAWQMISLRRRGQKIADLIHNKLEQTKSLAPTMALPGLTALASAKQLLPKRKPQLGLPSPEGSDDNRTQILNMFGSGPVTGSDRPDHLGHLRATNVPTPNAPQGGMPRQPLGQVSPGTNRQALSDRAGKTAGGVLRLGRAAAGGPQALALEAGKMVGQKATSRIVVDTAGRGTVQRGSSDAASAHTAAASTEPTAPPRAPTRRISIGSDGVGHVLPPTRPAFVVPGTMGPQR